MDHYETLIQQALFVKSTQANQKHPKFDALPSFLKSGLHYLYKFQNVRKQHFYPRYAACELMKLKGNKYYNRNKFDEAVKEYEQVIKLFCFQIEVNFII